MYTDVTTVASKFRHVWTCESLRFKPTVSPDFYLILFTIGCVFFQISFLIYFSNIFKYNVQFCAIDIFIISTYFFLFSKAIVVSVGRKLCWGVFVTAVVHVGAHVFVMQVHNRKTTDQYLHIFCLLEHGTKVHSNPHTLLANL